MVLDVIDRIIHPIDINTRLFALQLSYESI